MNRGYVKTWRKSLDKGWIRNHKLWAFWSWCLLKASYREYDAIVGMQVIHLMPGQFIFGRKKASEETGLTEREIRTVIASLISWGNLTIKTTNKFSIISIVNWPIYQGDENGNDQLNDQPLSSKGPHTNIKELKNKKTFLSDSIETRLSELLLENILSRNPNFKKPNIQAWAKDIDLMIRIDSRPIEEIRKVIQWCQNDPFWQGNILATSKLRKQFDQLQAKMQCASIKGMAGNVSKPPVAPEVFETNCSRCRRRITVKADLVNDGCVHCEDRHREVRA